MNFFDAKIEQSNGKLMVDVGSFTLEVPKSKNDQFGNHGGKDIVLGIRPEDLDDPNYSPPGVSQSLVEAKVDVAELMGNEVLLYLITGKRITLRASIRAQQLV